MTEQGFLSFVKEAGSGPLFFDAARHKKGADTHPADLQGRSLGRWIRRTVKLDPGVDPNHGWPLTWKTRALGARIGQRLSDAITGHSPGSVGRRYDPDLDELTDAMDRFPRYIEA